MIVLEFPTLVQEINIDSCKSPLEDFLVLYLYFSCHRDWADGMCRCDRLADVTQVTSPFLLSSCFCSQSTFAGLWIERMDTNTALSL